MTINKRRPELFALSDRNTPQRFGAPWHRPADKASLSLSERGPGGGGRGGGGSGEPGGGGREGSEAAGGAKSLRAVQVN